GPTDETGQHLNFLVSNDHPELFASQPSVAVDGTLSYTPAANANGSATLTVALHDDGGAANGGNDTSVARACRITIVPVNDAPSFTKGPDQTVLEDAGPQTVANWARSVSPGPADEATQAVGFLVVSNSNPFLFSAGPAVSSVGTLTYTPAANANGSALITLVLHDNGGTANGGSDTSAAQSFRINVTPVNDAPYANSQSVTVDPDGSVAITLSAGDVDGDVLSYTLTPPAHGTLSGTPPNVVYTPKPHYPGSDSFTFKV